MDRPHGVILTPAPDRVFLRLLEPVCEMTPAQALRVACALIESANVARSVTDGACLMEMMRNAR